MENEPQEVKPQPVEEITSGHTASSELVTQAGLAKFGGEASIAEFRQGCIDDGMTTEQVDQLFARELEEWR